MSRHTFIISISEDRVDPNHGASVFDVAYAHEHYPDHSEIIKVLAEHFSDWDVTVIPT